MNIEYLVSNFFLTDGYLSTRKWDDIAIEKDIKYLTKQEAIDNQLDRLRLYEGGEYKKINLDKVIKV